MRVSFPKGMQKRFFEYAKVRSGLSWREFRQALHISNHVHYRYEVCTLPLRVFRGCLRRSGLTEDEARKFRFRMVSRPPETMLGIDCDESLAELVGICLGDGYLTPTTLAIFGSKFDDTTYLLQHVTPLIQRVLGRIPKLNTNRPDENFLAIYSTITSRTLHRLGLPFGNKIANHARIPRWIYRRKTFVTACLRGLFDTDGSVYGFKRTPPARGSKAIVSFEFGKGSLLTREIHRALRMLGYAPRMMPHRNETRLGVNKDIVRFMNQIKPANEKHWKNFVRWHGPVV